MSKTVIEPGWPHYRVQGGAVAVKAGNILFVSGLYGVNPRTGRLVGEGDILAQTRQAFDNAGAVLSQAGSSFGDVVKTCEFVTTTENYAGTASIRREHLRGGFPAATGIIVKGLPLEGALIEIEFVAILGKTKKRIVNPGWPWFEKLTFSPGVEKDGFLFLSGEAATEQAPPTGKVVVRGNIVEQTRTVYEKMKKVMGASGGSMEDVVVTTEFITTTENYRATSELRREYFKQGFPTATGVIIPSLLRADALIEVDAVAVLGGRKEAIVPQMPGVDASRYTFSRGLKRKGFLFLAGSSASRFDPALGKVVVTGGIVEQTRQAYGKIKATLDTAGATFSDMVKVREYITKAENCEAVAQVRKEFFEASLPAVSQVVVSSLLRPEALVEVDGIAFTG